LKEYESGGWSGTFWWEETALNEALNQSLKVKQQRRKQGHQQDCVIGPLRLLVQVGYEIAEGRVELLWQCWSVCTCAETAGEGHEKRENRTRKTNAGEERAYHHNHPQPIQWT
jgi:hypothetical protein